MIKFIFVVSIVSKKIRVFIRKKIIMFIRTIKTDIIEILFIETMQIIMRACLWRKKSIHAADRVMFYGRSQWQLKARIVE